MALLLAVAAGFAALGFLTATWAASFEQVNFLPTFVVTPLTFLGGVFYSASMAPPALRWLTRANPIYYLVESLRWAVLGRADAHPAAGFAVALVLAVGGPGRRLRGPPERLEAPGLRDGNRRHFGIYFRASSVILRPQFKAHSSGGFRNASRPRRPARPGRHGVQEVGSAHPGPGPLPAPRRPAAAAGGVRGKLIERIDAAPYSYLQLQGPAGEVWAAVPQAAMEKGAEVVIENPMPMDGFESKTLNRKFEKLYFGTLAGQGGAPPRPPGCRPGCRRAGCPGRAAPMGAPPPGMAAQHAAAGPVPPTWAT